MNLELVSFKICPFVQRAVITLLYTETPYSVTYIDLSSPPDWFKQISPFGKVPVLKVNDDQVIFESAIIDEFLNEIHPIELLPRDPLRRAIDRSWIDFGSNLLLDFSGLIHSTSAEKYDAKFELVKKEFDWLEKELGEGPYFNGDTFSLVDIAYAPLIMRTQLLKLGDTFYPHSEYPKVASWADELLTIEVLPKSVVSDFDAIFFNHIKTKAPYAAKQLRIETQ